MKQTLKYILSVIVDNLNYAEGKHAVGVALSSGIIIFSAANLDPFASLATIFAGLSILFCSISIGFSLLALMSRDFKIKDYGKKVITNNTNLVYFKDIARFATDNYLNALIKSYNFPKNYKPDEFEVDLAKQVLLTAKLTNFKFLFFNKSIQSLAIGIIFTVVMVVVIAMGA
jgi:hypothetical protein